MGRDRATGAVGPAIRGRWPAAGGVALVAQGALALLTLIGAKLTLDGVTGI